ncbi:MAG TPA: diacylglycerol kinase family protein [Solirubrobacteraceae bacterium]|jgi:diacylglycerol kinase family enzyme|nr:diacylglycerol kinase family protein [Solirubrobacteraceae bacterium]
MKRALALLALLAWLATLAVLGVLAVNHALEALGALLANVVAVAAGWLALTGRGVQRVFGAACAVLALAGAVAILVADGAVLALVGYVLAIALASAATSLALRPRGRAPEWRPLPAPRRPVLLMNPWSGAGKVQRFDLAGECRRRGIEPIVLQRGDDLRALARDAAASGAGALGMAGGDGSQALVAEVAMEHDLPYVCVPAGTRNHLALDLGVDRDDVVGALDAYGPDGLERRIDLATINGSVFVNNVSLGVYASIVQSDRYRDDKLGTTLRMLPGLLGPEAEPFDLHFAGPDGDEHASADLLMVSNGPYRLDRLFGMGTRPSMDSGALGIVAVAIEGAGQAAEFLALESTGAVERFPGWRAWTATEFVVGADAPVPAGVDGEALALEPPLHFEALPAALRVRLSPRHPGRSPSTAMPSTSRDAVFALGRTAFGRAPAG